METTSIPEYLLTIDLSAGSGERQLAREIVYIHENLQDRIEEIMDKCGVTES